MKNKLCFFSLFILFLAITGWGQSRIISHVTSNNSGFSTIFYLENVQDNDQTITLMSYDQNGVVLNSVTKTIPADTSKRFSIAELFGSNINPSHFKISGDDVQVIVAYQSTTSPGSPAHLRETDQVSKRWRIFNGDWDIIWDGFAVVNMGSGTSDITVAQYDLNDNLIKKSNVIKELIPNSKGLYIIGSPLGSVFTPMQDSYFEITASEDLALTTLRGTLLSAAQGYLWENNARALTERPNNGADLAKWNKWLQPSYFRGFDVVYWCSESECAQTLQNFQALKNTGANLAQIQNTEGTVFSTSPYAADTSGQQGLDEMVDYCRQVGLNFTIAVRVGPGRTDVAFDGESGFPPSTIWTNSDEQQRYAQMLIDIVTRYQSWNDPFFVGLNIIVEPNPLWGSYETPEELGQVSLANGVDINALNTLLINAVRTVDPTLPIIVQSTSFSNPEYWGLLKKQEDPYIIYDHHNYVPFDYTHHETANDVTYPGTFFSDTTQEESAFNKAFMRDVVLQKVREFQTTHNVPIFMGEFGMLYPQNGGVQYLTDLHDIATEFGWHFALWTYRSDSSPTFIYFDPEKWDAAYWTAVLSFLAGAGTK